MTINNNRTQHSITSSGIHDRNKADKSVLFNHSVSTITAIILTIEARKGLSTLPFADSKAIKCTNNEL